MIHRRDPLDLATQQLTAALADVDARNTSIPPSRPAQPLPATEEALTAAVSRGDAAGVRTAVAQGVDLNAGKGKALRLAAERRDERLMQELVISGADVSIALAGLKKDRAELSNHATMHRAGIERTIETLEKWEKRFLNSIAPVETLRMQRKILDALAELKDELTGKPLDKPKFAAPQKIPRPRLR